MFKVIYQLPFNSIREILHERGRTACLAPLELAAGKDHQLRTGGIKTDLVNR